MTDLSSHAIAARIMAEAFEAKRCQHTFAKAAPILEALADAYRDAAHRMEAHIRAEIAAHPTACTIDHKAMKAAICPACGIRKGQL